MSLIAPHRIFRRAATGVWRPLFLRARVCPRGESDISSPAWRRAYRGDPQKITRSFVYARQFSRFRIQSVTNSERRRNSGRCGFSSELANAALRRRIQIRSFCMWLCLVYLRVHAYTHTNLHTSASSHPLPVPVYLSVSVHPPLTATYRKSPQRMCGHPRSIEDLLRRDGIVYFVSPLRLRQGTTPVIHF